MLRMHNVRKRTIIVDTYLQSTLQQYMENESWKLKKKKHNTRLYERMQWTAGYNR